MGHALRSGAARMARLTVEAAVRVVEADEAHVTVAATNAVVGAARWRAIAEPSAAGLPHALAAVLGWQTALALLPALPAGHVVHSEITGERVQAAARAIRRQIGRAHV